MAELTIDPTEHQEGEFTAEEQAALEVGERLSQEQEALLAGKFRDAEELENAYIELQKRFSRGERGDTEQDSSTDEQSEDDIPQEEEQEYEPIEGNLLDAIWEAAVNGEIPQELNEQLQSMDQQDIIKMYFDQRMEAEKARQIEPQTVTQLQESVGGQNSYKEIVGWAANNLTDDEIAMYDKVMDSGDPNAMWFAVQALNYAYRENVGYEGELLTGKPAQSSGEVFRSQAEVVRAMRDPRYDSDPAYRKDVSEKLERSDLAF